jgi:hypothetical protein
MKGLLFIFFLCVSLLSLGQPPPVEEILTNETIIQLTKAGLDKEVIKSKMNTSKCSFTTTTADLMNLSKNKVPNDVIALMIKKENSIKTNPATFPVDLTKLDNLKYGIFTLDSVTNRYYAIRPAQVLDENSMDFEHQLKSGFEKLFNKKEYISISKVEAPLKFFTYKPVFIFIFDTLATAPKTGNVGWENLTVPNDFFLVRMAPTKKNREFQIGKNSVVGNELNINDRLKIPFTTRKLRNGAFLVFPTDPIVKGEYCFIFASAFKFIDRNRRLYDFSVK